MREYRFWYHYNKPASRKHGYPLMTVHFKGQCMLTTQVHCNVPSQTHRRKRQPRMVVRGWAKNVRPTFKHHPELLHKSLVIE